MPNWLKRLLDALAAFIAWLLARGKPVSGVILLASRNANMAKKSVPVPNFTMAELASDGATLQLYDAGNNPTPLPSTPHTATWVSADPTVLTVKPLGDTATVSSTGKPGNGVRIDCTLHATDMPPSFPDIDCACTVDVPAGPPTQGTISLAS